MNSDSFPFDMYCGESTFSPFCLRDGGLTEQLYIVGILPEQIPNFLHLLSDGVREIFFGSEVIETAAIQSGVLCHDASPTFAINSSMSFA